MSFDLILPFFRPIEQLLLSDTVSEIMVNPDSSVGSRRMERRSACTGFTSSKVHSMPDWR